MAEEIQKLDPEAFIALWDLTIDKMVRLHDNISTEVQQLIISIQKTRDAEGTKMVPVAEEKATFGKVKSFLVKSMLNENIFFFVLYMGHVPILLLFYRKSKVTSEPCGQWSMKLSSFKRTLRSRWEV